MLIVNSNVIYRHNVTLHNAGADPGFSFKGGGGGQDYVRAHTHITRVKPEVLHGRGPEAVGF